MQQKKVLLIEPSKKLTDRRYSINLLNLSKFYYYPHLGLLSIQASLENAGCKVENFALNAPGNGIMDLKKILSENKYDFIGISTTTYTIQSDIDITLLARKLQLDTTIILGGYFSWVFPEIVLKHTEADLVVRGHGEIPLSEIVKCNLRHPLDEKSAKQVFNIPGVSVKYADGQNFERYLIKDPFLLDENQLNTLPQPHYSIEHWRKYWKPEIKRKRAVIYTSIGCPFNCKFCSVPYFFRRKIIYRNLNSVLLTIIELSKWDIEEIFIADSDFNVNKQRVIDFCKIVIASKNNHLINKKLKFICQARLDLMDEELIAFMKQAGFKYLLFGIETPSQRLLKDDIRKGGQQINMNSQEIKRRLTEIEKTGLKPYIYLIAGLPLSTIEELKQTINFAASFPIGRVEIEPWVLPFPETDYYKQYKTTQQIDNYQVTFSRYKNGKFQKKSFYFPYRLLPLDGTVARMITMIVHKTNQQIKKRPNLNFMNTFIKIANKELEE